MYSIQSSEGNIHINTCKTSAGRLLVPSSYLGFQALGRSSLDFLSLLLRLLSFWVLQGSAAYQKVASSNLTAGSYITAGPLSKTLNCNCSRYWLTLLPDPHFFASLDDK